MRDARFDGGFVFPGELPEDVRSANTCRESVSPAPRCPHCSQRVTHRDESESGRAQHFAHCPDVECNRDGGGTGGIGESDPHRWMKNIAEGHLRRILNTVNVERTVIDAEHVPAPVSDKQSREPDVILEFSEHDEQLGGGLFVETQWRHKDKDIKRVNDDYFALDEEYAVLWIDEDDFDTTAENPEKWTCTIGSERRLRELVRNQHWPERVPARTEWWQPSHTPRKEAFTNDDFNPHARDVSVPATFPEPLVDSIRYHESDWPALFSDYAADHFRAQAAIPYADRGGRSVSFRMAWWLPHTPAEYWTKTDWIKRFPDEHTESAADYLDEVAKNNEGYKRTANVPHSLLLSRAMVGARYYVQCPGCGNRSGSYSPEMAGGGRMCSCGTNFKIDTENYCAGPVLNDTT